MVLDPKPLRIRIGSWRACSNTGLLRTKKKAHSNSQLPLEGQLGSLWSSSCVRKRAVHPTCRSCTCRACWQTKDNCTVFVSELCSGRGEHFVLRHGEKFVQNGVDKARFIVGQSEARQLMH